MVNYSESDMRRQLENDMQRLLLEADLFSQQQTAYPWEPAQADQWFEALDTSAQEDLGLTEEAFTPYIAALDSCFQQLWEQQDAIAPIVKQFQIPSTLVSDIFTRARTCASQPLKLADKVVQCVQENLSLDVEDLQVLVRPYAYAMRDSNDNVLEVALRKVRCAAWTELSGIEQAHLSLAIARYAVDHQQSSPQSLGS